MKPQITPEYLASQGLTKTFVTRFWGKVMVGDGCWNWVASKRNGYGHIVANCRGYKSHMIGATRAVWLLFFGPIPKGLLVCHHCDNPACVRPDHLFLGDYKDNAADMVKKGRGKPPRGEKCGRHKLTEEQVKYIKDTYIPWKRGNRKMLERKFGIDASTITRIAAGKRWSHLHCDGVLAEGTCTKFA